MGQTASVIPPDIIESLRMLSPSETKRLLNVGNTKLFQLIKNKQNPLPSVKIGESRRFPLNKVLHWMETLKK